MSVKFTKAIKHEAKGKAALIGPAGSGKSYTMLILAEELAQGGKIAAVDTEHGSLEKYADQFEFDTFTPDEFTAQNLLEAIKTAESEGYAVLCVDSLSHFWAGTGGALEFVDAAAKRSSSRDGMSGWKEWRPWEQRIIDSIVGSSIHVICTMRTKTAYEEQINERTGKKQRVKIGLAPVQRDGLEYEFDFVGSMDDENCLIVDKTRCSHYAGKAIPKPKRADFTPLREWLSGEKAPERQPEPERAEEPRQSRKADVDAATVKRTWSEALGAASGEDIDGVLIPLIRERAAEFVSVADKGMMAKLFELADTVDRFNAATENVVMEAAKTHKDLVGMIGTEAKRRGYKVNRTERRYEEGSAA